jgi:hypothetical protein
MSGQAFSGQAAEAWTDQVENVGAPPNLANTAEAVKAHFKSLVQEFGKQYFGRNDAEDQKDAMDNGELTYEWGAIWQNCQKIFFSPIAIKFMGSIDMYIIRWFPRYFLAVSVVLGDQHVICM